jgi:pimeloyl-ACP methyl ester carboxylesterase
MTSPQVQPQSKFVEANGIRLHYNEWSTDGPPLIFLHGITSSSNSWDVIAPSFVDDYRVMAFDLRGHGQSGKPDSGYSWESDYARDISTFITEQLDEPAIVVGHSLGAVVSAPVAVQAGNTVRAIVLEDPPAFVHDNEDAPRTRFASVLAIKALPIDQRIEELMKTMNISREAATVRADNYGSMSESVMTGLLEGGTSYRPDELLPKIECSTLVILGNPNRGGVVDWTERPRIQRLLKGSKILEWPEVGHGIHAEAPDRFIATVSDFLKTLS